MRFILDTCILVDQIQPDLPDDAEWAISVASVAELHFGVLAAPNQLQRAARLRRLAVIENTLNSLPVTDGVARIHGAMAAQLKAIGRQPRARAMDLFIAATAASHQATLLTHNLVDFTGLDQFVTVQEPPLTN